MSAPSTTPAAGALSLTVLPNGTCIVLLTFSDSGTFTSLNPHDVKLLVMQRVIRFEDEMDAEVSLDLLENRIVGVVQGAVDDRVETDDDILPFVQVAQLHQLAPDLEGDGRVRLD